MGKQETLQAFMEKPMGVCLELTKDEGEMLEMYRKAKALRYSEIAIAIQEGVRVKLWLTEKRR